MERNKAKLDTGSDSFGEVSLNSISWSNWVLFKDSVCPEPAQAPGFSICLSFLPLLLPCCLSWPWLVSAVKRLLRTLSTLKGDLYFRIWNVFLQKTVIGFLWKETQSKMGWCYRNSSFFSIPSFSSPDLLISHLYSYPVLLYFILGDVFAYTYSSLLILSSALSHLLFNIAIEFFISIITFFSYVEATFPNF